MKPIHPASYRSTRKVPHGRIFSDPTPEMHVEKEVQGWQDGKPYMWWFG